MNNCVVLIGVTIVSLLSLPGCPGTPSPSPLLGAWTLMVGTDTIGLELMADGSAVATPAPDMLDGNLTWETIGTEFTLRRIKENPGGPTVSVHYVGRVTTDTTIFGAWIHWEGGPYGSSGLFSAQKQ
jgi:hypothetical protein